MPLWSVFLVGLGVSADAFAVAVTSGLKMRRLDLRHAAVIALTFAGFQAVMPLLGWALASQFARLLAPVDHWIAFGLLALVGASMIREAFRDDSAGVADRTVADRTRSLRRLLLLGLATSIDAAAVGVSFAVLDVSIMLATGIIGATTLALSFVAVLIGHRIGVWFRRPAEVFGGLALIAIGVRILLEHLMR